MSLYKSNTYKYYDQNILIFSFLAVACCLGNYVFQRGLQNISEKNINIEVRQKYPFGTHIYSMQQNFCSFSRAFIILSW